MFVKKIYLFALVGMFLLLNSCAVIQQNYMFKENGAGSFEMGADMSEALALMEMMGGAGNEKNGKEEDPLKNIFQNAEEPIDTILSMEEMMPDSIKGTPEGEAMKLWNMRMKVDKSKKYMYVSMLTDFTSLKGLGEQFKAVEKMKDSNGSGGPPTLGGGGLDNLSSEYFLNNMAFKKNKLIVKKYAYSEEELETFKKSTAEEDAGGMLGDMMQKMELKTRYQVPGKIQKIKFDGQYEKIDDSTVEITVPIEEVAKKGVIPALFVKWK